MNNLSKMTAKGQPARTWAKSNHQEALDMLRELAAIGAPTRHEEKRAAWVYAWIMQQTGAAADVQLDDNANVIWHIRPTERLSREARSNALVISAHTDVVFDDKSFEVREHDGRMYAPGIGDDTANLIVMLLCARDLARNRSKLSRDVYVVANVCEEGLGNLDGTKAVYEQLGHTVGEHVAFDCYLGEAINGAVGSHRWRVTVTCEGGHSYFDFGKPNAIHEMSKLLCDFYKLSRPEGMTVNAGVVEGGTTVNAIAAEASALLEYRSPNNRDLAIMQRKFEKLIAAHNSKNTSIGIELVGARPGAGHVDPDLKEALLARTRAAMRVACEQVAQPEAASTDVNVPLSRGIPAICVGAVSGAGMHTREEWIDMASVEHGLAFAWQLLWLEATLACQ